MSNYTKFFFALLGALIASITLFYTMTLKPNIDYFQELTRDVVKLRISAGYINDICLQSKSHDGKHFLKYMERCDIAKQFFIYTYL